MSGTPSKMLEHLLDTRLGVQMGPNDDSFLDDFLLTHIVFMQVAQLVDELASHYHNDTDNHNGADSSPEDYDYVLQSKKRVVQFIQRWVMAVRTAVFEDPAAAHFIEVSFDIFHTCINSTF
jgi:Rap guanine nucleotide exchange factor 4